MKQRGFDPLVIILCVLGAMLLLGLGANCYGQDVHPSVIITGSSSCKVSPAEIVRKIWEAKFPAAWHVAVTCAKTDWERWSALPEDKTAFSKGHITFVWGQIFETPAGNEILDREAAKAKKQ